MPGSMSDIIELRTGRSDSITVASRLDLVLVVAQPENFFPRLFGFIDFHTRLPRGLRERKNFWNYEKIAHRQQLFFNACSWARNPPDNSDELSRTARDETFSLERLLHGRSLGDARTRQVSSSVSPDKVFLCCFCFICFFILSSQPSCTNLSHEGPRFSMTVCNV